MVAGLTREAPYPHDLFASAIGFVGIILNFLPEFRLLLAALPALLLCIVGTLCFCAGNQVSVALQRQNVAVISANSWGMFYRCLVLTFFALVLVLVLVNPLVIDYCYPYLSGLIWLGVLSSVLTFACYLTLVGRIGGGKAGYATVMFLVFDLLISTMFEKYQWRVLPFAGICLVVAGNILFLRNR